MFIWCCAAEPHGCLVSNSGGTLVVWLLGIFAIGWRGRRFDRAQLTAFALLVVFGYMLWEVYRDAYAVIYHIVGR